MSVTAAPDIPYRPPGSLGRGDPAGQAFYNFRPGETWAPNVNLYESDNAYLVCVDLAGVEKEKIDIELADQHLTLRGARAVPAADGIIDGQHGSARLRVHLMEIDHGAFCRIVELPNDVSNEKVTATYRNGLLWIELPKKSK